MMADRHPRIGVAVIVRRGALVLLGKRRSATHGDGVWQFPGGHLEWGESVDDCARREVLEETGLSVQIEGEGPWTNDRFDAEQRHYVTLFMVGRSDDGEPVVREPDKCEAWQWFAWDALPAPLFLPIRNLQVRGWRPD
jgi:8-oxo-dGTP diphosphatase